MSALDPKIYGPPKSAITAKHLEQHLQGLSVNEVCYISYIELSLVQIKLLYLLYFNILLLKLFPFFNFKFIHYVLLIVNFVSIRQLPKGGFLCWTTMIFLCQLFP